MDSIIFGITFSCFAKPLIAQDPAETRNGSEVVTRLVRMAKATLKKLKTSRDHLEIMLSHRIFDDSMALGKAFMDTRFEHGLKTVRKLSPDQH